MSDAALVNDLVDPGPPSPKISGEGIPAAAGTMSWPMKELSKQFSLKIWPHLRSSSLNDDVEESKMARR